ncbi:hypothetical protein SDC9_137692 [bioreactor metagenome]|uniref:Uncharacterized protein n=1 Tax=bioreactor metagenome TaxID=1076179 RepID=A0A645DMT5_9ZZZZ
MQKPRVERIVARHALHLRGIQQQSPARLRDVGKPDSRQTRDILGWILAADVLFHADRLGPYRTSVIAHHSKDALHERAFSVSRRGAVQDKQTLKTRISAQGISQRPLQKPRSGLIAAHNLIHERVEPFAPCGWLVKNARNLRQFLLGIVRQKQ